MSIVFDAAKRCFYLDTAQSSYVIALEDENCIFNLYYGAKLPHTDDLHDLLRTGGESSFNAHNPAVCGRIYSLDMFPGEYPGFGTGDTRRSALAVRDANGALAADVRYVSHRIFDGKPGLPGLPATYVELPGEATTLELVTQDATGLQVTLYYTVFEEHSAMTRHVVFENRSENALELERAYSACVHLPEMKYDLIKLFGCYGKERSFERSPLSHGVQGFSSTRGSSGHWFNPFMALTAHDATEETGDTYGFSLVYSGDYAMEAEVDYQGNTRVLAGLNPEAFSWHLEPGETFCTPEVVMVYSPDGIGGMSRAFHRLFAGNLIRGEWKTRKRPLLINTWEAAFFDFNTDKLLDFAAEAAHLGVELLVLDDGWFGVRDDDTTSLGDWWVNDKKLAGGLPHLVEEVNRLGLKFGIWFEPENISLDSDLYRAHPEWALHIPGRVSCVGRHSYVLDMSRADVRDYLFEQMSAVLSSCNIEYVKWDFNRNLTETWSALLPTNRQKELRHRWMLGTYELLERLHQAFPHILLESCSGGGGRFDAGMLYYGPQVWCSDNTDPFDRTHIQFGTSLVYPASTMGAHVSAHTPVPFDTRAAVAMWGTFGYELDPRKLTDEEKAMVRQEVAEYHRTYRVIHEGELYRIQWPEENGERCAWEFVTPEKDEALFVCVNLKRVYYRPCIYRLRGLDPARTYEDIATGKRYSGQRLMRAGLSFTEKTAEWGTNIRIHFKAVD